MMDLVFIGMKVGMGNLKQLDFVNSFNNESTNQTFTEISDIENKEKSIDNTLLPIYDILLAGVE